MQGKYVGLIKKKNVTAFLLAAFYLPSELG
jgi:hypothetical protein